MRIFGTFISALIISLSQTALANTFKTEKWLTRNGVHVVFYQAMEVPMLDISIAFAAGSAYDSTHFGLSALTSNMLNQGNSGQDATAIAEALADHGAQFNAETSRDMTVFNLRTLTSKDVLLQSTHTFSQIINHPDFPDEAFEREKKQVLMAIEQSQDSPEEVANIHLFKALYQNHPYAHPVNGTADTIKNITKNQVVAFYKRYFIADNALVVMVGAIDNKTAHQVAEELTKELPRGKAASIISKAPPLLKAEHLNIKFPSSQTVVRLGQIGIDHQNPNYFGLMAGNYILGGGGLTSRLAIELRAKRGLTYGVDSQFAAMPGAGPFIIGLSTQNKEANNALKITEDTLHTFINEGPDKQELEAAKQYLTGSFPLSLASNRSIASLLLRMNFYHLPDDYLDTYVARINAVTSDEIKKAFAQTVSLDKLVLITVGQS